MYGREYMGVVRTTFIINPDGDISAIWSKVRVKNHANEVMEKLKELQG
jgi:peroxiredoxin Q/BCP